MKGDRQDPDRDRIERMQREGQGIRGYSTSGRTDRGPDRAFREAGGAGGAGSEERSESESAEAREAQERQTRQVREDAESRRDIESPRSPEEVDQSKQASPRGRDEVRERQRRDREEMGRPPADARSRDMQERVVERRDREAEENELR